MKKLEKLLDKIYNGIRYLRLNIEIVGVISVLAIMLYFEVFGIVIAVKAHNYLILSIFTYIWVWMISEAIIQKIFFKKFNYKLLETPKSTSLILFVLFVVNLVLSWQYFAAFIFVVILAFLHGDYNKTKSKVEEEL